MQKHQDDYDYYGGEETAPPAPETLHYKDLVTFNCKAGYHVGGMAYRPTSFSIRCKADGTLSTFDDNCMMPRYTVMGQLTDAQSASIKLKNAQVSFSNGEASVASTQSDNSGRFTVSLPAGEMTMKVTNQGYITKTKKVSVTGRINRGQGADAALSKVLPPGGWRTTVNWDRHPGDVDSHAYFGPNYNTHVYWPSRARTKTASGTGGIKVVLDRDDVNGFVPETTTFLNLGQCSGQGRCLIKFQIKKYSGRANLDQAYNGKTTGPFITVYKGDKLALEFDSMPPANIGRNLHTVFTLWAGSNPKLYKGEMKEGPYLDSSQKVANWWGSLDSSQWSKVPSNSLLTGLYRHPSGSDRISAIEEGRYRYLKNSPGTECYNQNWWGSFDSAGWSFCNEGYFMAGLYRTGNMWDGQHGIYQLEEALCCKPKGGSTKYGACSEDAVFERNGLSQCDSGKALAGLYRSSDSGISGIDKMKCCELDEVLMAA